MRCLKAGLEHAQLLADIEAACLNPPWSHRAITSHLQGPFNRVFLYYCKEQLIGYAAFTTLFDECELHRIAVLKPHRRKGLGSKILEDLTAKIRNQGVSRILLEVAATNSPARGLYSSHGFVLFNTRLGYYSDGDDAMCMHKELQ